MRHIIIRLAVGIIWLVAAAVSCVQGNYLCNCLGFLQRIAGQCADLKKEKDKRER